MRKPEINSEYTVYGNPDFDRKIGADMEKIARAVTEAVPEEDLAAVILGGGYGRGEGGVTVGEDGSMALFNDYDMFVFTTNVPRKRRKYYDVILREVGHKLGEEIGIDVDFGPSLNRGIIPSLPLSMMWYDLKFGHKIIYGDQDLLKRMPKYDSAAIPIWEAWKLMLNRGVGLMLAAEKIENGADNPAGREFIERNICKAVMGAGDSFLVAKRQYHFSYLERVERMEKLKDDPLLVENDFFELYSNAVNYKLKAPAEPAEFSALTALFSKVEQVYQVFLLNVLLNDEKNGEISFNDYLKCDIFNNYIFSGDGLKDILKNITLNFLEVGLVNFSLKWFLKYPRWRLYFSLPYFLYGAEYPKGMLHKALGINSKVDSDGIREKFFRLWRRFN